MAQYNTNLLRGDYYLPYGKLILKTAPTDTAVTLAEAKSHLRVDFSDDDSYITTLIDVATQSVEEFTRRKLMLQTWTITFDEFPQYIDLQLGIVDRVDVVYYYDNTNVQRTLHPSQYDVDLTAKPGRIYESKTGSFPTTYERPNAVEIDFKVGYTSADSVPAPIKQAILIIIGRYYENRQDVVTGTIASELPLMVDHLLTPYRLLEL